MFGLKKRSWIIGGVVAALLGTAAFASKWHDRTPEERAAWATDRIAERLDLDDAQRDAFRKVADKAIEIRGSRPEFMAMLSGQLKQLAADDTLTVDEVNQLRDQIKSEFDKRTDAIIPEFVSFYNTLNDEQRATVVTRIEQMGEHMGERRHGHGKGHGWWRGGDADSDD
ncbi:MAG: Spy/CpxP family protein refolding chaperone [Nitratireductor sp.]|nr:Spy/CpxP family protein refolding chaperone [Nitratireductor sp.]